MVRHLKLFSLTFVSAIVLISTGCNEGSSGSGGKKVRSHPWLPLLRIEQHYHGTERRCCCLSQRLERHTHGSVVLTSGNYTSSATTLSLGSASITIPAGSLAAGADTLTVKYTPDSTSSSTYLGATATATLTVTVATIKPTVTVTPAASSITTGQSLAVTVGVSGTNGTPTGSIVVSSGTYTSAATTLALGSGTITISRQFTDRGCGDADGNVHTRHCQFADLLGRYGNGECHGVPSPGSGHRHSHARGDTHPYAENLIVTATVSGASGTPTGNVMLSSGSFTSPAVSLNSGSAAFYIQPGSLALGPDHAHRHLHA